jgi:uroporphyrinogen decarboxylase
MTHRERVLTALHHQEPDRVPLALWGSAYGIIDGPYKRLRRFLKIPGPVPSPFRRNHGHTVNYMDDDVLTALDVDVRYVWTGATDINSPHHGKGLDVLGVEWGKSGYQVYPIGFPLSGKSTEDIAHYKFPSAKELFRVDELRDRAKQLAKEGKYALYGRAPNSYGLFDQASYLRGIEEFMIDFYENPEAVQILLDKIADWFIELYDLYLDLAGDALDLIELPGDDYAGTAGPIIGPAHFDQFFKAPWRRVVSFIKSRKPDLHVLFHCDGDSTPFIPRFLEIGADVHHPLEFVPNLDMNHVKRAFGDRLTILGALDIKGQLIRSKEGTELEIKRVLEQLAPGGGFILAPANHVQIDIPPENLVHAFRFAQEAGRYPIAVD